MSEIEWGVWVEGGCGGWLLRNLGAPYAWTGSKEEADALAAQSHSSKAKVFDGRHDRVMPFGRYPR